MVEGRLYQCDGREQTDKGVAGVGPAPQQFAQFQPAKAHSCHSVDSDITENFNLSVLYMLRTELFSLQAVRYVLLYCCI
jgi:hypothetical protein